MFFLRDTMLHGCMLVRLFTARRFRQTRYRGLPMLALARFSHRDLARPSALCPLPFLSIDFDLGSRSPTCASTSKVGLGSENQISTSSEYRNSLCRSLQLTARRNGRCLQTGLDGCASDTIGSGEERCLLRAIFVLGHFHFWNWVCLR